MMHDPTQMTSRGVISRRRFLNAVAIPGVAAATGLSSHASAYAPVVDVPTTAGVGEVRTPTFYRYELGIAAPRRLHEMTADDRGVLWCSPLDGRLVRYDSTTGVVAIVDLPALTGEVWANKHLYPIAVGREVYLCSPTMPRLWVYEPARQTAQSYALPHQDPRVHGGFQIGRTVYFYDLGEPKSGTPAGMLKWDPSTHQGTFLPCPYRVSGPLIMTFADEDRREIWGSTDGANDLVRFDASTDRWTGHWHAPEVDAMPTPALAFVGETLYLKDHLKGRLLTFDVRQGRWGKAIPIPGYRDWFGWVGGGHAYLGLFYFSHSTWTGGTASIDGQPHHFIDSWSVFDPKTHRFSRLRVPSAPGESFIASKGLVHGDTFFITAVNAREPRNAIVLRSRALATAGRP